MIENQSIAHVRCSGVNRDYRPTKGHHRHKHHEILMIEKGGGTHSIDYQVYPVCDNQVFFLRPGQVHQFSPSSEAVFYFVAIDQASITLNTTVKLSQFEFFQSFNSNGYVILSDVKPLIDTIKRIEQELFHPGQRDVELVVASLLTVLLVDLRREFLHDRVTKEKPVLSDVVTSFNQLLDSEAIQHRFVKHYAKELYVSPNYLNECVKKETGRSASEWIQDKLTVEAKRLLKQSSKSITQIAHHLHFPNSTHFCRFFKQHVGQTPGDFRVKYSGA